MCEACNFQTRHESMELISFVKFNVLRVNSGEEGTRTGDERLRNVLFGRPL